MLTDSEESVIVLESKPKFCWGKDGWKKITVVRKMDEMKVVVYLYCMLLY